MKFYGAYAWNDVGIYTNYGKLLWDRRFMRGERIKSFEELEEAEAFAVDGFEELHGLGSFSQAFSKEEELQPNYFYFYKRR